MIHFRLHLLLIRLYCSNYTRPPFANMPLSLISYHICIFVARLLYCLRDLKFSRIFLYPYPILSIHVFQPISFLKLPEGIGCPLEFFYLYGPCEMPVRALVGVESIPGQLRHNSTAKHLKGAKP